MRKEIGASPGSLVYTGDYEHDVFGKLFTYDADHLSETEFTEKLPPLSRESGHNSWLLVQGVHDLDIVKSIGQTFGLHRLVLEDMVNPVQRMKVEDYEGVLFLVLKMVEWRDEGEWESRQFNMLMADKWTVLVTESETDFFEPIVKRLKKDGGVIRKSGADYMGYAIIDLLVDHYMHIVNDVGDRVEDIDAERLDEGNTLADLKSLQHYLTHLKRYVRQLKELLQTLLKDDMILVHAETKIYLRDVYDHALQCADQVESLQDSLNSALNHYHSHMGLKLNEIMKFLTMMGSIFIPLTFVAGIYGMNFQHMPELAWKWGYPAVVGAMVLITVGLVIYFKIRKWF